MEIKSIIKELKNQHPEFMNSLFTINQQGWANVVLVVDGQWVFRISRDREAGARLTFEKAILPVLKERLDVTVPDFQYSGSVFGQLYVGYPLIPGEPLSKEMLESLSEDARKRCVKQIAGFLSVLHELDPEEAGLTDSGPGMQDFWNRFKDVCLNKMPAWLLSEEMQWVEELFMSFEIMIKDHQIPLVLIHADFTEDHILFDEKSERISGIIDFGDLQMGDPALDFAGLSLSYGESFMMEVAKCYQAGIDDGFFDRIQQFYLQQVPMQGLLYGIETKNEELIEQYKNRIRQWIHL